MIEEPNAPTKTGWQHVRLAAMVSMRAIRVSAERGKIPPTDRNVQLLDVYVDGEKMESP